MPPPLRPPTQARSRDTLDRLLAAFEGLLEDTDYDAITVAALVREAGTSVGAFYARFQGKDALLFALVERVLHTSREALLAALADRAVAQLDLAGIIGRYTRVMVARFQRHRPVWLAAARHAGGPVRDAIMVETRRFNDAVHGRFRVLAQRHAGEIGHPDPAFSIEFGLFQASAAAREAILARSLSTYSIRPAPRRLVDEIVRGWCGYLALETGDS